MGKIKGENKDLKITIGKAVTNIIFGDNKIYRTLKNVILVFKVPVFF